MFEAEKAKVLDLARKGVTLAAIRDRVGWRQDRTRRAIERAIERGELPADTLDRCGVKRKPTAKETRAKGRQLAVEALSLFAEEQAAPPISVWAPDRASAARLGSCSACTSATEIEVKLTKGQATTSFRLCRSCAPSLAEQIATAFRRAEDYRRRLDAKVGT
jgi:hypothetical protein